MRISDWSSAVCFSDLDDVDVLLVEDNPEDAELTLRALRKRNAADRLLHVDDGAKAIAFLFSQAGTRLPRFILLVLKLPKIDGLERSEARRVGQECVRTCRSQGSQ